MPSTLKTPGVYIEEIVKFPPSVAQVETAIPAFIGYTEKATKKISGDLNGVPTRISSLLQYETYFGSAKPETTINVTVTDDVNGDQTIEVTQPTSKQPFIMYYSMQLYFANGGGPCYINSVGQYGDGTLLTILDTNALKAGLDEIAKVDEPTLIVFPDLSRADSDDVAFYGLYNEALAQCNKLQDRFTIIDTHGSDNTSDPDPFVVSLRNNINGSKDFAKYGAVYYPYLETILDYKIDPDAIIINHIDNFGTAGAAEKIKGNLAKVNTDAATVLDNIITTLTSFSTTGFAGKLADVVTYLYNDNAPDEGFDISGTKNFTSPRPATLHTDLEELLTEVATLIDLKNNAKVEADATVLALEEELPLLSIDAIKAKLKELTDLFDAADTIEKQYDELVKLTNSLKKHILKADTAKIESTIDSGAKNIVAVIGEFISTTTAPADADTTLFDAVATKFGELNTLIATEIDKDTNNGEMHGRSLSSLETDDNATYNKIKAEINNLPMELPPSSAMAGIYARVDSTRGVWKAPANVSLNYVTKPTVRVTNDIQDRLNVDTTAGKSVNAIRSFTGKGVMVWGARTLAGNDNEWRYVSVRRFFNMVEESVKKASDQFVFEANDANTWVRIRSMIENFLTNQWKAGALAGATPDDAFYVKVGLNQTMTADDILNGIMNVEIGMAVVRPAEFIVLKFSHKMQES
ncbi:MAG: phage tail sheath C-terminal domain-containing protein [Kordia sp.]|uniref:phage tail sheath C-terminal domain-containing protein n=1 Tax=Kordia sp. TaxID=1965332 RepID=UPI0038594CFB